MSKYNTIEWENKIQKACKEALSMASACASLGMNKNTFISHAKRLGVYITNAPGKGISKENSQKIDLSYILAGNAPQYGTSKLRTRLLKEGIKKHVCEKCLRSEWGGQKIPLELHHIDGNSQNHILTNLEILCPNCHTVTENFGSKNKKYRKKKKFNEERL